MAIKMNLDKLIEEKLNEEIIRGEWEPGKQIDLNRIMHQYDVSRTPVIHALKKMDADGLVRHSSKGHFYVPDIDLKTIRDITTMRKLLELQGLREIISYGAAVDLDKLIEINEQCEYYTNKGKLVEASGYDMQFHKMIVDAPENQCLSDVYEIVQRKFRMVNCMIGRYKASQQGAACMDHVRIIDYLNTYNYEQATRILEDHISEAYLKIEKRFMERSKE